MQIMKVRSITLKMTNLPSARIVLSSLKAKITKTSPTCIKKNETSRSDEEELLYQGSKTSKILSFVLIVSSTTICIKQLGQIFFNC